MQTRTALTAPLHLAQRPAGQLATTGTPPANSRPPGRTVIAVAGPPPDLLGVVNASRIAALQGAAAAQAPDRMMRPDLAAATAYRRSQEAVLGHPPVLPPEHLA